MRLRAALVVVPLLASALLVPAHADAQFVCQGQEATIVGYPGDEVVGTDGPDVVLVFDSTASVHAGAGNDLICVNGLVPLVDAGPGDDSVAGGAPAGGSTTTILGQGGDTFYGGEGYDEVVAGTRHLDDEKDTITTGDGGAVVYSGDHDRTIRGPNADVIVLARGDTGPKTVWYSGPMGHSGRLDAGYGGTTLHYAETGGRAKSWEVDVASGLIEVGGADRVHWTGHVTRFDLSAPRSSGGPTELVFDGTSDSEVLHWSSPGGLVADVRMGPGADRVRLTGSQGSRAYGGAGADRLTGGGGDDLLRGGTGQDRVDGRGGTDSCYGEVRLRCER